MTSSVGTYKGKLRSVGSRPVRIGMARIMFDGAVGTVATHLLS